MGWSRENNRNFVLSTNLLFFVQNTREVIINQLALLLISLTAQSGITWSITRHFVKYTCTFLQFMVGQSSKADLRVPRWARLLCPP